MSIADQDPRAGEPGDVMAHTAAARPLEQHLEVGAKEAREGLMRAWLKVLSHRHLGDRGAG